MNVNPTEQSVLNRASKDKFLLVLDLPIVMKNTPNLSIPNGLDTLNFSVYGTVVPTIAVPSIALPFGGQVSNISSYTRPNYEPITINFVVDNKFVNYYVLWQWLNVLNTADGSIYGGSPTTSKTSMTPEYQTSFSVYALDEYNQKIASWVYVNAFITGLGGITYDNRTNDWIESTVTFQFSRVNFNLLTPSLL